MHVSELKTFFVSADNQLNPTASASSFSPPIPRPFFVLFDSTLHKHVFFLSSRTPRPRPLSPQIWTWNLYPRTSIWVVFCAFNSTTCLFFVYHCTWFVIFFSLLVYLDTSYNLVLLLTTEWIQMDWVWETFILLSDRKILNTAAKKYSSNETT